MPTTDQPTDITIQDLIIEAMPFSKEIIAWCHKHPDFKEALKVTNPDNFYALGQVTTTHTKNVPDDLVIGFLAYDMQKEIFKQDFIVDIGERHDEFVLYTKLPSKNYNKYVKHINQFYVTYGKDGDYADTHHVDINYIKNMGNQELYERALKTIQNSEKIMQAGGRRHIPQEELEDTLAKIRKAKALIQG